jgi:hypothetical protein
MYVVTYGYQIENQVREYLACGGLIREEEPIDEDDLQTDAP